MTGLPARRARAAAAKNASGRRIFSSASAMTLVSLVVDEEVEVVGHVGDRLVAGGDQHAEPDAADTEGGGGHRLEQRAAVRHHREAAGPAFEAREEGHLAVPRHVDVSDAVGSDHGEVATALRRARSRACSS